MPDKLIQLTPDLIVAADQIASVGRCQNVKDTGELWEKLCKLTKEASDA